MNFYEHACVVLVWYVISFFYIRLTLAGIISYQLNNSTLKKRKQGQSVREWFLYKRFRDVFPKILLLLYFVILFGHPVVLLLCCFFDCVVAFPVIGRGLAIGAVVFDIGWCIIYSLLFWRMKPGTPYFRWIKKKRGMPPKRRK